MKNERKILFALTFAVLAVCFFVLIFAFSPKKSKSQNQNNNQNIEQEKEKTPAPKKIEQKKNPPPKIEEPQEKTEDFYADIPPAKNGATLVFIFDDAGQNLNFVKKYTDLPFPLAISVLPGIVHTKESAALIRKSGKELMLHQPMQSENLSLYPGPKSIQPEMTINEIKSLISENIAELGGGVSGINNHEGSLITANPVKAGAILEECKKLGIFFLDSRTTAQSAFPAVALEMDIPILERNAPYIDNEISREKMLERLMECFYFANKNGVAVMIGHIDKSVEILPALLLELYPHLKKAGYRFAFPSSVLPKTVE